MNWTYNIQAIVNQITQFSKTYTEATYRPEQSQILGARTLFSVVGGYGYTVPKGSGPCIQLVYTNRVAPPNKKMGVKWAELYIFM